DGVYKAFVSKVGGDLDEATRMQGNAQVLTDSAENRRQSVRGFAMDEEMSNLVRFQRAYQASARAMSTMDEMLDVLINRTGRAGLSVMRIQTSMIQRNVLSDLNSMSEKMARTQSKASSGKEITRPSDDPFNTARGMGQRQTMDANNQYSRNIDDAMGWQEATESALGSMND